MSTLTRRGFIGSLTALVAGAVVAVRAKPVTHDWYMDPDAATIAKGQRPRLVVNKLHPDWQAWIESMAKAARENAR